MKIVVTAVFGVALLPIAFYGGFEFAANRVTDEYNLPRISRNSIKHALTAASVYNTLRTLHVDRDSAEHVVLALGFFNETLETYVKIGGPDSLGEQRKDLHNNWAGIVAAEWRLTQAKGKSLTFIIAQLAETGTLILQAEAALPPATLQSANTRIWFNEQKLSIARQVVGILGKARPRGERNNRCNPI